MFAFGLRETIFRTVFHGSLVLCIGTVAVVAYQGWPILASSTLFDIIFKFFLYITFTTLIPTVGCVWLFCRMLEETFS